MVSPKLELVDVQGRPIGMDRSVLKLRHVGIKAVFKRNLVADDLHPDYPPHTGWFPFRDLMHVKARQRRQTIQKRLSILPELVRNVVSGILKKPLDRHGLSARLPISCSNNQIEHVPPTQTSTSIYRGTAAPVTF